MTLIYSEIIGIYIYIYIYIHIGLQRGCPLPDNERFTNLKVRVMCRKFECREGIHYNLTVYVPKQNLKQLLLFPSKAFINWIKVIIMY